MCLNIIGKMVAIQAARDITTFKRVYHGGKKGEYESEYRSFNYTKGYYYYETDFNKRKYNRRVIGKALHSYVLENLPAFSYMFDAASSSPAMILIECVIPKGAYYYIGDNNDIASSGLVIIGTITPSKYRKLSKRSSL